jgi:hypothetical protein
MNSSTRIFHYAPVKAARVPGAFAAVSLTHKNPWPLPAGNRVSSQAGATSSPNYHHEREQGESNDHRQGRTDRMAPDFKVCISRSKARSWFEGGPPFSRLAFRARSSKDRGSLHPRCCRLHGRFPGAKHQGAPGSCCYCLIPKKHVLDPSLPRPTERHRRESPDLTPGDQIQATP